MNLLKLSMGLLLINYLGLVACQPMEEHTIGQKNSPLGSSRKRNNSVSNLSNVKPTWTKVWVITGDTSNNYLILRKKALQYSKLTGWKIDSLGRSYSDEKNEIIETDSLSLRFGLYTPRQAFGNLISIEQKEFFQTENSGKSFPGSSGMVIVFSMHSNRQEALQSLAWLKRKSITTTKLQAIQVLIGRLN